jgi:hypothetical protein
MAKKKKILIIGALALLALWWWKKKGTPAAATIANAPAIPKPSPIGSVQLQSNYGIKYG